MTHDSRNVDAVGLSAAHDGDLPTRASSSPSSSSLTHPEQGWQPMLQRAHDALDAADRLMARHSETFFPVERWQEWRRRHRQALCDVLPLPTPPSPPDPEK
jgi:hypothetical protein